MSVPNAAVKGLPAAAVPNGDRPVVPAVRSAISAKSRARPMRAASVGPAAATPKPAARPTRARSVLIVPTAPVQAVRRPVAERAAKAVLLRVRIARDLRGPEPKATPARRARIARDLRGPELKATLARRARIARDLPDPELKATLARRAPRAPRAIGRPPVRHGALLVAHRAVPAAVLRVSLVVGPRASLAVGLQAVPASRAAANNRRCASLPAAFAANS